MKFTFGSKIGTDMMVLKQSNPLSCFSALCCGTKIKVLTQTSLSDFQNIVIRKMNPEQNQKPLSALKELEPSILSRVREEWQRLRSPESLTQVGHLTFSGSAQRFCVRIFDEQQPDKALFRIMTTDKSPNSTAAVKRQIEVFWREDKDTYAKVGESHPGERARRLAVLAVRPSAVPQRKVLAHSGSSVHHVPLHQDATPQTERTARGGLILN